MTDLFSNPELIRNARSQLRWGRLLTAAAICAALSLVIGYAMAHSAGENTPAHDWGMAFLKVILTLQVLALFIGGGLACLHTISREKEMNTFDFQRVTRLTPLELALGKLFGAPAMVYFVVLCFMPAAIVGGVVGRARPTFFVASYVILLLGCITFHAFALLVSMLLERGTSSAAVLFFLAVVGMFSMPPEQFGFDLGAFSPFVVSDLVEQTKWTGLTSAAGRSAYEGGMRVIDVFFGLPVHHVLVLLMLYLTFTAWFLLAIVRNIKRDPTVYELYTPIHSLALALYVNLLLVGFFRWRAFSPLDSQAAIFGLNVMLFFLLGLALLRNRERLRRLLREAGAQTHGWFQATWPAPYVLAGTLVVGLAVVGMIEWKRDPRVSWDLALALFRVAFFALWLARDILYLQWMNLRRSRRPLVMAALYLIVFYACAGILFGILDWADEPSAAVFAPTPVFALTVELWRAHRGMWLLALVAQAAAGALFVRLQHGKLLELSIRPVSGAATD